MKSFQKLTFSLVLYLLFTHSISGQILGNTNAPDYGGFGANYMLFLKVVTGPNDSGTFTHFGIFDHPYQGGDCELKFALYSHNVSTDRPSQLLAQTYVANPTNGQFNEVTISTPPAVLPNTTYWIGLRSNCDYGSGRVAGQTWANQPLRFTSYSFFSSWPTTAPGGLSAQGNVNNVALWMVLNNQTYASLNIVTMFPLQDMCIDDGIQSNFAGGTPLGGVYSGPGITDDGNGETYTFDPVAAGLGVKTITYTVNGSSATGNVEVLPACNIFMEALDDLCADQNSLLGVSGGTPAGGIYSGPGVTDEGNGSTYTFDPSIAGEGIHTLSYTINGFSATDEVEVLPACNAKLLIHNESYWGSTQIEQAGSFYQQTTGENYVIAEATAHNLVGMDYLFYVTPNILPDASEVASFLANGGKILYMGEGSGSANSKYIHPSQFMSDLGSTMSLNDICLNAGCSYEPILSNHPMVNGLTNIRVNCHSSVELGSEGIEVVRLLEGIVLAGQELNGGEVYLSGDIGLFNSGCTSTENMTLLQNILDLDIVVNCTGVVDISTTPTHTTCGNNNGIIDVSLISGIGPITYTLDGNTTSIPIQGLAPGTYLVEAFDGNGCTDAETVTINSSDPLSLFLNIDDTTCGDDNGVLNYTVNTGSNPIVFTDNSTGLTVQTTGIAAGSYAWTATDNNNCTQGVTFTIDPSVALSVSFTSSPSTCQNSNGIIDATVNSGTGTVNYTLDGSPSTMPAANLAVGFYSAVAIDQDGCMYSESVEVEATDPLDFTLNSTATTCNIANGEIDFTFLEGAQPVTYTMNGNVVAFPITGLAASTYAIDGTDANGCELTQIVTVDPSDVLDFTLNGVDTQCGNMSGEISANIISGTAPITFEMNGNPTTLPLTGLSSGSYTIVGTDAEGCMSTQTVTINGSDPLVLDITKSNTSCGLDNGSIDVNLITGQSPVVFTANGSPISFPLILVATNTYNIVATDANGCIYTESIIVEDSDALDFSLTAANTTCNRANGEIEVSLNTGAMPVSYTMNGNAVNFPITGLAPGTYMIVGTDSDGCQYSQTATINSNDVLSFSLNGQNTQCGVDNGEISINLISGSAPITYTMNGIPTTFPATSLAAGTYTIFGTDADGCTYSEFIYLDTSDPLTLDFTKTNTSCGLDNGSIDVNLITGQAPVVFTANGNPISFPLILIAPNTFNIVATDANGCIYTESIIVEDSDALDFSLIATSTTCNQANGEIEVSLNTGAQPVSYTINGNAVSFPMTGLTPGTYMIDGTDAEGCQYSQSATVNPSDVLEFSLDVENTLCAGINGEISTNVITGTTPITYTINGQAATLPATGLGSGIYQVEGTDAEGCIFSATTIIDASDPLVFTLTGANTLCNGDNGVIDLAFNSGTQPVSYTINGTAISFPMTNLMAGTYIIDGEDAEGCLFSSSVEILGSDPLDFTLSPTHTLCAMDNGALDVTFNTGSQPVTYSMNGSTVTFPMSGLAPGNYIIDGVDDVGCIKTISMQINDSDDMDFTLLEVGTDCGNNNGSITIQQLSGNGQESYRIDNGPWQNNPFFDNLTPGVHTVDGMDGDGCMTSLDGNIDASTAFFFTWQLTEPKCNEDNGSIRAFIQTSNPPVVFSLDGGPFTSDTEWTDLDSGFHSIEGVDAEGCNQFRSVTWQPTIDLDFELSQEITKCGLDNGVININTTQVNGIARYALDGGSYQITNQFSGLPAGLHFIEGIDSDGCVTIKEISIGSSEPARAEFDVVHTLCDEANGAIHVNYTLGVAPYVIQINGDDYGGQSSFVDLVPGIYSILIKDALDCQAAYTIEIEESRLPRMQIKVESEVCESTGGSIDIKWTWGHNPFLYRINDNAPFAEQYFYDSLAPGVYHVSMMDRDGCIRRSTVELEGANPPILNTLIIHPDCKEENGDIEINIEGGKAPMKIFMNGVIIDPDTIQDLAAGNYLLEVIDGNGCFDKQELVLSVNAEIDVSDVDCDGSLGSISVNPRVNDGYTYLLNGIMNTTGEFVGLDTGIYTLVIDNGQGCSRIQEVIVGSKAFSTVSTEIVNANCIRPGNLIMTPENGQAPYLFIVDDQATRNGTYRLYEGMYEAKIIDANGCLLLIPVEIGDDDILTLDYEILRAPTAGKNDGILKAKVTGGMANYLFFLDGVFTPGAIFSNVSIGLHTLSVIDGNECEASIIIDIEESRIAAYHLPSDRFTKSTDIKAYPNPFLNIVHLTVSDQMIDAQVEVLDRLGRLVNGYSMERGDNTISIKTEHLSSGLYFIHLRNGEQVETLRVLKY